MRALLSRLCTLFNASIDPESWRIGVRRLLVALAVIGGIAIWAVNSGVQSLQPAANDCQLEQRELEKDKAGKLECLNNLRPSSLTLELAGTEPRLSCQLRFKKAEDAPSLEERVCAEARIALRRDELRKLDARVLIPVYVVMSLLIASWVWLNAPNGRGPRALAIVGLIALATLALATLDGRENQKTLQLLTAAEASLHPALHPQRLAMLGLPLQDAHTASQLKWAAAALWSIFIALGLWQSKPKRGASPEEIFFALFSVALSALGGILMGAASVLVAVDVAWQWQVQLLKYGFFAAAGALVVTTVSIYFSRGRSLRTVITSAFARVR